MKSRTKAAVFAVVIAAAICSLAVTAEAPPPRPADKPHRAIVSGPVRVELRQARPPGLHDRPAPRLLALQQGLRMQKQLVEMMADPVIAAQLAITRIKDIAIKSKRSEAAIKALQRIAGSTEHAGVKRSAMFAVSELHEKAGNIPEAVESLMGVCKLPPKPQRPHRPGMRRPGPPGAGPGTGRPPRGRPGMRGRMQQRRGRAGRMLRGFMARRRGQAGPAPHRRPGQMHLRPGRGRPAWGRPEMRGRMQQRREGLGRALRGLMQPRPGHPGRRGQRPEMQRRERHEREEMERRERREREEREEMERRERREREEWERRRHERPRHEARRPRPPERGERPEQQARHLREFMQQLERRSRELDEKAARIEHRLEELKRWAAELQRQEQEPERRREHER